MSAFIALPRRHVIIVRYTWAGIGAACLADTAWMYLAKMHFPARPLLLMTAAFVCLGIISILYRHFRRDDALWLGAEVAGQLIVGSCALAALSYLVLRMQFPLQDTLFMRLDAKLGFDWLAYIGWVNGHPWAAQLLTWSYLSTGPEIVVLLLLLAVFGQFTHFHRFALGYFISGFVTVVISGFLPALAAYIPRGITPDMYPNLQIAAACAYRQEFLAARDQSVHSLPEVFEGIITFPSFHSALAVLAFYAAPALPFMPLRAALIALNGLMLLSTPVDGGHYLVDSLSGALIALSVCIGLKRLLPLQEADR